MRKKHAAKEEEKPRMDGRRRFFAVIYGLLLVCCIVVCSWTGYTASYVAPLLFGDLTGTDSSQQADLPEVDQDKLMDGKLCIVLAGWDHRKNETIGRSDTLMVAFVDLDQKSVRLLSIPRDTYVSVPGNGSTKINHAFAYGGIDLTKQTLAENFGIEADYYATVDFEGFKSVIDAVGGVTIDVPKDMRKLSEGIDLSAGPDQHLNGDQSLQFVRFRDSEGDEGRVHRQQEFMVALKDEVLSFGTVLNLPTLSTAIIDCVQTDLNGAILMQIMMSLGQDFTLETYQPAGGGATGPDGLSYYYLDSSSKDAFFNALVNYEETVPGNVSTVTADAAATTDATPAE